MIEHGQTGDSRRIWAAVPFKGPAGSKRRLSGLLDEAERARLSLAMLDDVLDAVLGVRGIERVLLLRPPEAPWERGHPGRPVELPNRGGQDGRAPRGLPGDERLTVVDEIVGEGALAGRDNLNATIRQAQTLAEAGGADALLIVPADLPLVTAADLGAVLVAGESAPVAIAPDRAGGGTNALLLAPPSALVPSFGEASFERHRALAEAAGLLSVNVERPGLALDLDTPADVAMLLASGRECRAARLLRGTRIGERLEREAAAQARSTTI